jgi:hypothetical protein
MASSSKPEVVDRDPLAVIHARDVHRLEVEDDDALVQDVVVLDVRPQRERRRLLGPVEEDRGAGDPGSGGFIACSSATNSRRGPAWRVV